MAKEVERKYLVVGDSFRKEAIAKHEIKQWYLSRSAELTVRLRISDDRAFITIKGITRNFTRNEWEYEIPVKDAEEMLAISPAGMISKTRHILPYKGKTWEIDEFHNVQAPDSTSEKLIVAEIELNDESEKFELPPFVGKEVTGDPRYYNSQLVVVESK